MSQNELQNKKNDLTVGNPIKLILMYSVPLLLGSILHQLYNIVDSIVVGNFVGETALAAVGTSGVIMWIAFALFIGFGAGSMILASQLYGANDTDTLKKVLNTCCATMNILTIPVMLLGIVLSKPLLSMMNVPSDAFGQAYIYLVISFIGIGPVLGYNLNSGFLRGIGDSKSPLKFLIVSTIINVVLDILFVAIFNMGVAGVALATAIAQFVAWIYSIIYIKKHYSWLEIKPLFIKPNFKLLIKMFKLGLPISINEMLFAIGIMMLQGIINTHGTTFMAGYNASSRLDSLGYLAVDALYTAVAAFCGQNIGAKKYDRIKKSIVPATLVSCVIVTGITSVLIIFGKQLLGMFSPEITVIDAGYAYLVRVMPFYALITAVNILNGYMQGAGETIIPALTNLSSVWLIRLPAAYMLNKYAGRDNIFFCYAIGWVANITITIIMFKSNRVQKKMRDN